MNINSSHLGLRRILAILLPLVLVAGAAHAADLRAAGRKLVHQYEMAIVNVRIVITIQNGNDQKIEASGTVISPDGLTIVPLDSVDPMSIARRVRGNSDNPGLQSRVKDIKLLVNKRTEIPATIVLRDDDLNIALLRPLEKPAAPMTCIDIKNTADAGLLEQVVVLARMGRVADRQIGAMTGEIQAIVEKPRKFYIPSSELASGGYGVPIFNAGEKLIGIVLMRINVGATDAQNDIVGIILPAKDIQDFVAQAPAEIPRHALTPAAPAPTAKPAAGARPPKIQPQQP